MSEFADYVHEQLVDLGEIEHGRFFGGTAFKLGGTQFAMCMDNTYVVDDQIRWTHEAIKAAVKSNQTKKRGHNGATSA